MRSRRAVAAAAALSVLVLVAACGGGDDEQPAQPAEPEAAQPAEPAPAEAAGAATTLPLAADPGGALAFDTGSLEAPAGTITIDFTNEASVPHNVTIEGVDGGATSTFTASSESVTVDLAAGTYTFFCSVPGHREAGMEGTLTVG